MVLPDSLEQLRQFLGKIPTINAGGCGIAALAMYREAERLGLKAEFQGVYFTGFEDDFIYNMAKLECGRASDMILPCHMIVEVEGVLLDSRSIGQGELILWTYRHNIPVNTAIAMIEDERLWKPTFVRAKYLPYIETYMGIQLVENRPLTGIVNMKRILEYIFSE